MTMILARVINRAAALSLVALGLGVIFFPQPLRNAADHVVVLAVAASVGTALVLVRRYAPTGRRLSGKTRLLIAGAMSSVTGAIAFVVGRSLAHSYTWDASAVMVRAEHHLSNGFLAPELLAYLQAYPNNVGLFALDRVLLEFSHSSGLHLSICIAILNALSVSVGSLSIFFLCNAIAEFREAVFAQGAYAVLSCTLSWLAVPYTDLPASALLTCSAALVVIAKKRSGRNEMLILAAAAVCLGLATQLKPTAWILAIALAGYGILVTPYRPLPSFALRGAVLFATIFLTSILTSYMLFQLHGFSKAEFEGKSFPAIHFIRMGMVEKIHEDGFTTYGGYDRAAVDEMYAAGSEAERKEISKDAIAKILETRGVPGYSAFLGKKAVWIWQDATFGSWREGADSQAPLVRDGPISTVIQDWAHPGGAHFKLKNELLDGFWLALLIGGGVALWRSNKHAAMVLFSLSTLGIAAFTLMFEGRARYLILFLPLILVTLIAPMECRKREMRGRDAAQNEAA